MPWHHLFSESQIFDVMSERALEGRVGFEPTNNGSMIHSKSAPEWRNWQTRRTQNPVAARP